MSPSHEVRNCLLGSYLLVYQRMHASEYRQLQSAHVGINNRDVGGGDPLHGAILLYILHRLPPHQSLSASLIARLGRKAREHQIAHAGESVDRSGIAAHRHAQLPQFVRGSRDYCREGVRAETHRGYHPRTDCQGILQRSAQLNQLHYKESLSIYTEVEWDERGERGPKRRNGVLT